MNKIKHDPGKVEEHQAIQEAILQTETKQKQADASDR